MLIRMTIRRVSEAKERKVASRAHRRDLAVDKEEAESDADRRAEANNRQRAYRGKKELNKKIA